MIWSRSVHDMICLWYEKWMTNIYMLWYDMNYIGMKYVISWHVYDMIYCDAICYGMRCIWGDVMLKDMEYYVMSLKLYVQSMIWMTWNHDKWHKI